MKIILIVILFLNLGGLAIAQDKLSKNDLPRVCQNALNVGNTWQQCLEVAPSGHPIKLLAHMNVGTIAFKSYDFEKAAKHYDLSVPDDGYSQSDIFLHTYRAATFSRIGRDEDARSDAQKVNELLLANKFGVPDRVKLTVDMRKSVLEVHLRTLFELKDDNSGNFLAEYMNYPVLSFYDVVNRAGLLTEIGLYEEAEPLSKKAVSLAVGHDFEATILNNHCYLLALMKRGDEAVGYCERAISMHPESAGFYHSYSTALEVIGDCKAAQNALKTASKLEPSSVKFKRNIDCDVEN